MISRFFQMFIPLVLGFIVAVIVSFISYGISGEIFGQDSFFQFLTTFIMGIITIFSCIYASMELE